MGAVVADPAVGVGGFEGNDAGLDKALLAGTEDAEGAGAEGTPVAEALPETEAASGPRTVACVAAPCA